MPRFANILLFYFSLVNVFVILYGTVCIGPLNARFPSSSQQNCCLKHEALSMFTIFGIIISCLICPRTEISYFGYSKLMKIIDPCNMYIMYISIIYLHKNDIWDILEVKMFSFLISVYDTIYTCVLMRNEFVLETHLHNLRRNKGTCCFKFWWIKALFCAINKLDYTMGYVIYICLW